VTLIPIAAFTVTCNACTETLEDDGGGTVFTDPKDVADAARAYGWTSLGGQHLCPTEDDAHQVLVDRLMPPEPTTQTDGQSPIGEE